jgi:YHS domain-containing protein
MLEVLLPILYILAAGAVWRLVGGVVQGMTGTRSAHTSPRAVHMVRDPVCGTYIIPERAVVASHGRTQLYFCSAGCRDKYLAHTA